MFADGHGGWSESGCKLIETTDEFITCSCNHLTSFSALMVLAFSIVNSCHLWLYLFRPCVQVKMKRAMDVHARNKTKLPCP